MLVFTKGKLQLKRERNSYKRHYLSKVKGREVVIYVKAQKKARKMS